MPCSASWWGPHQREGRGPRRQSRWVPTAFPKQTRVSVSALSPGEAQRGRDWVLGLRGEVCETQGTFQAPRPRGPRGGGALAGRCCPDVPLLGPGADRTPWKTRLRAAKASRPADPSTRG